MMEYLLYDDLGAMAQGSLQDCVEEVLKWLESEEAEACYTESELVEAIDHFKEATGETSFFGFNIVEA